MSETEIGRRRVGRPAAAASASGDGAPAVRLQGVRLTASAPPLDLDVGHGEIVGLTGLLGSGATTLLGMLGGAAALPGAVEIGGQAVRIRQPLDARAAGIGYIAEDRKGQGLILDQTVAENIALASLERTSRGPLLNRRAIDDQARRYADELDIRMPSIHAPVSSLSGGNQQKVLIARWLASGVRVLVIDEPTHGVDIAGKLQIHALLRTYAQQGGAVLIASTDVDEILALCDRVGVMRHGALASLQSTEALSHLDVAVLGVEEAAA
jgi:ABC-type sugar transport system ATPase subunit